MRPLAALLEELFALHGHHVTAEAPLEGMSGAVYTIPILAESEGRAVVVSGHLDGTPLSAATVEDFAGTVGDVGADVGVLVHTGGEEPGAAQAGAGKVLLWSRETVVRLLGEAQVAQSLAEAPPPLPLAPPDAEVASEVVAPTSLSEALPPAFRDPEPQPPAPSDEALGGLADLLGGSLDALEAPRRPKPVPEDDDLKPFPPIENALPIPPLPAPPPLDPFEADLLPPAHPLFAVPALAAPVAWVDPTPSAPLAAPVGLPVAAPAPPASPAVVATSPTFGRLAAAARTFAPPMAGPPPAVAPTSRSVPPPPSVVVPTVAAVPAPAPGPVPAAALPPMPPAPPATPSPLPPFPAASLPVLPVRVRVEEAKRRVRDRLFSIRAAEVLLQPVHLYAYEVDVLKEGSLAYDTLDGRVQVHGSDRTALEVDPDQTNPSAAGVLSGGHPYAVEERVLRVAEERARQLAHQHVVARHTRSVSVRVPDHNNGLFYTEKRKVAPTSDQVRLRHLGVHLRPVWRLHGANGLADIDATDGRELMAEVRGGRTDAILIE